MAEPIAPTKADLQRPRLVGRDRELALLRDRLSAALAGHGCLVLIGGDAGIGKTALAEGLAAEASNRGALTLVGRCYDLADTPPYGPWRELFARRDHDADAPSPPAIFTGDGADVPVTSQGALFTQAEAFLGARAARGSLVLLLDDLHWADRGSLDLLRVLARRLADLPVLVLATYRADELTQRHPLASLLPALVREARATRLDLRPLDDESIRELTRPCYELPAGDDERLVAYLRHHAEGNPFYVGELLRTLEEEGVLRPMAIGWRLGDLAATPVPPLLRQVIDGRVTRLGEAAERLLALAAVIGQETPLDLWATVADTDEEIILELIERAVDAHLLEGTAAGARFAHALVREALYERLVPVRRRRLHRQVAEALLARPAADPDVVAYHLRQANDRRAAEWLTRAGERAERAYAWLTAAERYEAALALADAETEAPEQRVLLLLTLAQLRRYTDPARGLPLLAEAEQLALATNDRILAAAARFDHGHLQCLCLNVQAGVAEMEAALPILAGLTPAERVRLPTLRILGVAPAEDYHREAFVQWLSSARPYGEVMAHMAPIARRVPGTSARGLSGLAKVSAMLGQTVEARRAFVDAHAAYLAAGQQREVANTLSLELHMAAHYCGDEPAYLARLADESEMAVTLASSVVIGVPPRLGSMAFLWLTGRWAEARAAAPPDSGLLSPGDSTWYNARPWLAHILRAQGEWEHAWRLVQDTLPGGPRAAPTCNLHTALEIREVAAGLALDAADLPAARDWLEGHDLWLAWSGAVLGWAEGQLGWAAYHRAAGELALARHHAEQALTHAMSPRQPLVLLATHRLLGELDTVADRHADAADHFDQALALADACAAPYERALTLLALAELHLTAGRQLDALPALDAAKEVVARLEAWPTLARFAALTAQLAARPAPPSRPPAPAGLSARELEVLRLLAHGATDAQIAAALSISVKTVNKHVASVLDKAGCPNRAAAAVFAARSGLV